MEFGSNRRHLTAWFSILLLMGLAVKPVYGQGDWPSWGHDAGNQRHSPLTQINAENVSTLVPVWRYNMVKRGVASKRAQSTPLMVNGVLYLSFPYYRVVALKPETGEVIWEFTAPGDWNSEEHQKHWTGSSMRGLAYWPGEGAIPPQIVLGTEEGELISLDAKTGIPNPKFGNNGTVNLKTPDVMNGFPNLHYGIGSGVKIYKHLVFTPVHNADEAGTKGPAGDTRAWDLRTGEHVWTFHSVPHAGEFGNETWHDDSWRNATGANTWSFFAIDEERGILYMPLGSAQNDFYGMDRRGDNLFANSIVALDAMTGKRLWHFQAIHHDLWDQDMPAAPVLFDVVKDGKTIPAVSAITKYPLLFIFNRVTGEPIYEIEERPVPAGTVPGEYYSPTQPFPVKPPPLGRVGFTTDDIATLTPEHTAACRKLFESYDGGRNRGPYSPPSLEGTMMFAHPGGGIEFTGATFDPSLGYYIVNNTDGGYISALERIEEGATGIYVGPKESPILYNHVWKSATVDGWPCWKTPWSTITAVDVNTGEFAWQIPFGSVEGTPPGIKTGDTRANMGGPTSTAGGIFFIGATTDQRFRAFETKTGRELWSIKTEQRINANPITYMGKDGNQYVSVVANTVLLTYALPEARKDKAETTSTPQTTIWNGVYTDSQAKMGQRVYQQVCTQCHLDDLSGAERATILIGKPFLSRWNNLSLSDMVNTIRDTMPPAATGSLSDEETANVTAYLLHKNKVPSGDTELSANRDDLLNIIITNSAAPPSVDLWTAARTGNIGALEEHQAAGTNLNAPDPNGSSALHAAARLDQAKAADWLLTNGAFVDFRGGDGGTPLITAAFMGHPKTVKVLLKHGADVNATNDLGASSLQVLEADWELTRYIIEDLLQLLADRQKIERGREQIRPLLN